MKEFMSESTSLIYSTVLYTAQYLYKRKSSRLFFHIS
jgi:hypothetical protein